MDVKSGPYHRRPGASKYIQDVYGIPCAPSTLATRASRGGGPRFHKVGGAVLYPESGLDEWAQYRLGEPVASTSELPPSKRRRKIRPPPQEATDQQERRPHSTLLDGKHEPRR
jgi:hypothetical protein